MAAKKKETRKRSQHLEVARQIEEERREREFFDNKASQELLSMIGKLERAIAFKKAQFAIEEENRQARINKEPSPDDAFSDQSESKPVLDEPEEKEMPESEAEDCDEEKQQSITKEEADPEAFSEGPINGGRYDFRAIVITAAVMLCVTLIFLSGQYFSKRYLSGDEEILDQGSGLYPASIMPEDLRKRWEENRAINSDYIGNIVFDSGLLDLVIVQADDVYNDNGELYEFYSQDGRRIEDPIGFSGNEVYIWSSWKNHEYDGLGSDGAVFMDYRNSLSDQNLILYGHHIARDYDPLGGREFTPLDLLLEEENYEENKTLKLILDKEIRKYLVSCVFTINANDKKEIEIIRTDLKRDLQGNDDPDFLKRYLENMKESFSYDTQVSLSNEDRILTLVTCIQHRPDLRQIVLCREVERISYEE